MSTEQTTSIPKSSPMNSRFTFVLVKPTHYDDRGYPI